MSLGTITRQVEGGLAAIVELLAVLIAPAAILQNPVSVLGLGLFFFAVHLVSRWMLKTPLIDFCGFSSNYAGWFYSLATISFILGLALGPIGAVAAVLFIIWALHLIIGLFTALTPIKPIRCLAETTKTKGYYLDVGFTLFIRLLLSFGLAAAVLNLLSIINIDYVFSIANIYFGFAAALLCIYFIFITAHPFESITMRTFPFWAAIAALVEIAILTVYPVQDAIKIAGNLLLGGIEIYMAKLLFFGFYKKVGTAPNAFLSENFVSRNWKTTRK
jgi:hypothetical protein